MKLPVQLVKVIQFAIDSHGSKKLASAIKALSNRYRASLPSSFISDVDRLAYLCILLPATYSVMKRVFQERPSTVRSIVDFGAGLWEKNSTN